MMVLKKLKSWPTWINFTQRNHWVPIRHGEVQRLIPVHCRFLLLQRSTELCRRLWWAGSVLWVDLNTFRWGELMDEFLVAGGWGWRVGVGGWTLLWFHKNHMFLVGKKLILGMTDTCTNFTFKNKFAFKTNYLCLKWASLNCYSLLNNECCWVLDKSISVKLGY